MNKVSSVISTNPNYDAILGERLNTPAYHSLECDDEGTLVDLEQVLQHFEARCARARPSYYQLASTESAARHLAFASTLNNRRELASLEAWLDEEGVKTKIANIADAHRLRSTKPTLAVQEATITAFKEFTKGSIRFTKGLLHQLIAYASFVQGADLTLSQSAAEVLVVANDHSPGPVAYERIARSSGMKTVYLQHAEVTENFPPLDFDLSVLRNLKSKATYENVGKVRGDVLVLSRSSQRLRPSDIAQRREGLCQAKQRSVVIYPSGVSSLEAIHALSRSLRKNIEVSDVAVKLHPADKNHSRFQAIGLATLDGIPSEPHVAICGNSSVAIELISSGHLVYQCFELDSIPSDYYGFVADGLAYEVAINDCSSTFVLPEHSTVNVDELANVDARITSIENILERVKSHRLLKRVFDPRASTAEGYAALHQREILLRDLVCFTDATLELARTDSAVYGGDSRIISVLDAAFAARDSQLVALFSGISIHDPRSTLELWLTIKAVEWNGKTPSSVDIQRICAFVRNYEGPKSVRSWLEAKNLDLLIRYGTTTNILDFFRYAQVVSPRKLSANRKVALDRFIKNHEERSDELRRVLAPAFTSLTRLEALKLSVQNKHELDGNLEYMDYRSVEHAFCQSHPELAPEYHELVQKPYLGLGGRSIFIDVERNPIQRQVVLDNIKSHLQRQKGYSFIRLSDGEGFIFKDAQSPFSEEDSSNRQRHWWGEVLPPDVVLKLRRELQHCVRNADLLGIPSIYRFLRDHSDRSKTLLGTIQGRGLVSVLQGVGAFDTPGKRYTDDKANLAIFRDKSTIAGLAEAAGNLIVVSSGTTPAVQEAFAFAGGCIHVPVPTHYKTVGNSKYVRQDLPLPYVYDAIRERLAAIVKPGDLVLVGAGVAGKVFVGCAKDYGAVGLDIGSSMDQLLGAGIESLH